MESVNRASAPRMFAACVVLATCVGSAGAADDGATARKLATNHCGVCHTFGDGEPARQGPNLFGVLDRPAGTVAGFAYSAAFVKALRGKPWTPELLDRWLTDPQSVAPGAVMLYRQDDPDRRALLVRFLESLR